MDYKRIYAMVMNDGHKIIEPLLSQDRVSNVFFSWSDEPQFLKNVMISRNENKKKLIAKKQTILTFKSINAACQMSGCGHRENQRSFLLTKCPNFGYSGSCKINCVDCYGKNN